MRPSLNRSRVGLVATSMALAMACSASDPAGAPTKVEAGPGESAAAVAPTATPAGPGDSAVVAEPTATPLEPEPIATSVAAASTAAPSDERSFAVLHAMPFRRMNGEALRIADLKGKAVVLNFWASWCPPCRWEMPAFERIWQE